ncbi:MAG: hypothetical protein LBQ91_00865 [Oscillospiraceae bacterium]|jgi:hypothetical protein|nr:hypothetical protein [Oscillospiraceae bacterium]
MKKAAAMTLVFLLTLTFCACGNYHMNKDGTVEKNYQKDIDTIYVCPWSVFRHAADEPAYKIDLKNNAYLQIKTYASETKDEWGSEDGDRGFQFVSRLEDSNIDVFFRESARLGLTKWRAEYNNYDVLDGSSWYMKIVFSDGTVKEMSGVNAYPDTWDDMMGAFEDLVGEPLRYSLATNAELDAAYAEHRS